MVDVPDKFFFLILHQKLFVNTYILIKVTKFFNRSFIIYSVKLTCKVIKCTEMWETERRLDLNVLPDGFSFLQSPW